MKNPTLFPKKLKPGSHVRVIAPSRSLALIGAESRTISDERLRDLGLRVSFGEHTSESDGFRSSAVASRVADLHAAFADSTVDAILTVIGGFNSNQLLRHLDWNLIRVNPKIFCGYSDITALGNAIFAQTGLVTYSGPRYSTLGMRERFDYTLDYFQKCLFSEEPFEVRASPAWSDDLWYLDQSKREFLPNAGHVVLQTGTVSREGAFDVTGTTVGANLCTFNLLQGTEYIPPLSGAILLAEEDEVSGRVTDVMFERYLQSVLHQPGAEGIRGVLVGRFQKASTVTMENLRAIFSTKPELAHIPVIANLDFGHTDPYLTLPIGGTVRLEGSASGARITVERH